MNTIPTATRLTKTLWHVTPLVTGAVIMILELVAFRLYAPYFGYSIYVWGGMISVVMAALAAGYGVGGWLADRSQTDRPLYLAILLSAVYQLVVIMTVNSFLPTLARLKA
ncbi:MAG: fused MFS/spermidine synthase [Acidobacteria bacterium]|nr:fused MFS/spermidine synthase [Acidobacteriota bacterium]